MKRFIITFISMLIMLLMMPCMAYAAEEEIQPLAESGESMMSMSESEEETSMGLSESDEENIESTIEYTEVSQQDVNIYVTDGYKAISGAEVEFAGQTLMTDESGHALFLNIPSQEEMYSVTVNAPGFGNKTVPLQVENKIIKTSKPFINFTVSYWTNDYKSAGIVNDEQSFRFFAIEEDVGEAYSVNDDPNVGKWVKGAEMSTGIMEGKQVLCNGKIYIVGGWDMNYGYGQGRTPISNVRIYDIATDTWTEGAKLPVLWNNFSLLSYGDKIYVTGVVTFENGSWEDNNAWARSVNIYDTVNDMWIEGQSAPEGILSAFGQFIYNNKIYADTYHSHAVHRYSSYDLNENIWSSEPDMTYYTTDDAQEFMKNILYKDKLFEIYGHYPKVVTDYNKPSKEIYNKFRIYDFTKGKWREADCFLQDQPFSYTYPHILSGDDNIYVIGHSCNGDLDDLDRDVIYIYDINKDIWREVSDHNLTQPQFSSIYETILYDNKIYIIGRSGRHYSYIDDAYYGETSEELQLKVYDILKDQWSMVESVDNPRRSYFALSEYHGKLYLVGGKDFSSWTYHKYIDIYTIKRDVHIDAIDELPDIVVPYGSSIEYVVNELEKKYPTVGVILENGERIEKEAANAITIDWSAPDNYDSTYGDAPQRFIGTLTNVPDGISNSNLLKAYVDVSVDISNAIKVANVNPNSLSVDTDISEEEFNNLLPKETIVELVNGDTKKLSISSWDKSQYMQGVEGKYTVYGTIQLADGVVNPRNIRAKVQVEVNRPATQNIEFIKPIQMTSDQSVPLEQDGLMHSLGVPVTVPLSQTVEAKLVDGGTIELGVNWDIASYNPHQVVVQTISGDVVLPDDGSVENPNNIKAELEITVVPKEYKILDSSPKKISVEVLAGTTKEQILEQVQPKIIDVEVANNVTNEVIYIYTGFTFDDENNASYDPNKLGKQTLMGRFYSNFLDTVEPPYVEVEVNVVEAEIVSVAEKHLDAYQYTAFNNIPNLPSQVTITLENGMTVDVDVAWRSGGYDRDTVGDQLISGDLVNLPAGIKQPQEAKTAPLIVHVLPLNYKVAAVTPDDDFFDTDKDGNELYAGFTLSELREKLPVDKVKIQLESITEGVDYSTEYEVDFTLDEENNTTYVPEEEFLDNLYGNLALPTNISNQDALFYEFIVQTNPVEIVNLEPAGVMVDYYTEFSDINLPKTVYAELSNGQRKAISVDWGTGEGYNPDPEDLTEDNPVVFTVNGTLIDIPQYINHYDTDIPQLNITLVLPKVYNIVDVSPVRIPETGSTKVNLGSSLADIYDMLESHNATVTIENLKGVRTTQDVTFTLREEDNGHYDSMSEDEVELIAYLNLSDGVNNPNNKQLIIAVQPTKYVIRTTVASRVNGVLKGTAFADIDMPDRVTVNYTDTVTKQGEVPVASWDGSKYNPDKIGNQAVKGTFPDPLPVYVSNPNNRTPSAIVNVVDPESRMLSAKQVAADTQLSGQRLSVKRVQAEKIDGYVERIYEVELLHKDGSITTEVISIFVEVEE